MWRGWRDSRLQSCSVVDGRWLLLKQTLFSTFTMCISIPSTPIQAPNCLQHFASHMSTINFEAGLLFELRNCTTNMAPLYALLQMNWRTRLLLPGRDIFGFRQGHFQFPKDLRVLPPVPEGDPPDIVHVDNAVHGRSRRLLSHAFSAKALEEQHSMIMSYADLLIRRLHENVARPQDLVAWYNWTTFDLTGDLTFGEPFDCLRDQRYHPWVHTILEVINGGVAISAAERYGLGGVLISLTPKSMKRNFELMWDYSRDRVARRLERCSQRPDFMSQLMRHDKDRKEMTQPEMEGNTLTLIVAGSETTASLLSGATYHLLMNPNVLRQVTEEVRNAFRSKEELDCTTVNRLGYLTAVLKESLRIYPPAPSSFPRRVSGKGDVIGGRWVPPNVGARVIPFLSIRKRFKGQRGGWRCSLS
jgi:cytochrome P450